MSDPNLSAPSFGQTHPPVHPHIHQPPPPHQMSQGHSQGTLGEGKPVSRKRIAGIQPALFVGMCLLAVVTLITVVLIFTGDFESQASRVGWTVFVFLAFTGLLALDLGLARRDSTPLVLGVAGNTYLLAVLMLAIWLKTADRWDLDGWLFGVVILTLLVVRAAVAAAWGLLTAGRKSGTSFGRGVSLVAGGLLGLAAVLLTFHFVMDGFGVEPSELYWRATVAVIVVAALASSVTVLLFWNRRNLEWEEAEAAGLHRVRQPREQQVAPPIPQAPANSPVGASQPAPVAPTGLLPWPTYADGSPLPAGRDGQPVFPVH